MPRGPENREDHSQIEMRLQIINHKLSAFIRLARMWQKKHRKAALQKTTLETKSGEITALQHSFSSVTIMSLTNIMLT